MSKRYQLLAKRAVATLTMQEPDIGIRPPGSSSLLIAYILQKLTAFSEMSAADQVKIRFLFDLYLVGDICSKQLRAITERFGRDICSAAEILSTLREYPDVICSQIDMSVANSWWGVLETIVLLGAFEFGGFLREFLESLSPGRMPRAWALRMQRVKEDLRSRNMFTDDVSADQVITRQDLEEPNLVREDSIVLSNARDVARSRRQRLVQRMNNTLRDKRTIARLKGKLALSQRTVKRLEKMLFELEQQRQEEVSDAIETDASHTPDLFFQESDQLRQVEPNARRYSSLMLKIGHLLQLTSPKTYAILRQFIPLPCVSTLREHFSFEFGSLKDLLLNVERVPERIHQILSCSAQSPTIATIGVDAFAFRTFSTQGTMVPGQTQALSNGFLFVSIPLDASCPVKVIHLEPREKGCFDGKIRCLLDGIVDIYREQKGHVWFVATDGDRFLNADHDSFFEEHVLPHEVDFNFLLDHLYDYVLEGHSIPVSDPLHFGKNMRGKLLDHNIVATLASQKCAVNADTLQRILNLGDTLTDKSSLGRMRDYYVTRLFTLANVLVLLKKKDYHSALVILPYACVFTVLYSVNLSIDARISLTRLAYLTFQKLYREAQVLVSSKCGVTYRKARSGSAITMAEPCFFRRMMNTCLAFGLALVRGPRLLRMDAIGTHLVENMIGIARSISNDTSFERIATAFVNSDARHEIAKDIGITIHVARRINDGGAKVETLSEDGLPPLAWDPTDIVTMIMERDAEFGGKESAEFDAFLADLDSFTTKIVIHKLHHPSAVANALIVERNHKFQSSR